MAYLSGGVVRATPPTAFGGAGDGSLSGRVVMGPSDGLRLATSFASYSHIYRRQLWVATLVNKLAFGTARLPFKVYRRTDLGRDDGRDTPFGRLMRSPNPVIDPFMFWLWTSSTYDVYGEAMWVKVRPRPGAAPSWLWPMHPTNIDLERDEQGVLWYVFRYAPDRELRWPSHDIVHFKTYNPDSTLRGLSRLEPLQPTLLNEDAIRRAQQAFWKNGARPSVLLEHPKELSDGAAKRVKAAWTSMHAGIDSWGKTAVLEEGMKPHVIQLSAEEMQMIESRKVNREEACAIYDVPPPVVHILDRATFSNITEQMRSQYRDTQTPRLGLFESVIEHQLRPDFDPHGEQYGEFLLDEVLRGSPEQRAEAYQKAVNSGWMMPSEVREKENMPDAGPESHQLYINGATVPLALAGSPGSPGDAGLPETGGDVAEVDAQRTVAGRLSRVQSVDDIDVHALTRGLSAAQATTVRAHVVAAQTRGDAIAVLRRALVADLTPKEANDDE